MNGTTLSTRGASSEYTQTTGLVKRIVGATRGCNGHYADYQRRNKGEIQEVFLTEETAYGDCCICNHSSKRTSFCRQKAAIERSTGKPG